MWLKSKNRNQTAQAGAGKADCYHALAHLRPHPTRVSWGNLCKGNLWIWVNFLCTDCSRRDADGPVHSKARQCGRGSKQAWCPGLDPAPAGRRTPLQQSFCFSKDLAQPCPHSHLFCFLSDFYLFLNWGLLTVRLMHF